jgi:hypothetical protein
MVVGHAGDIDPDAWCEVVSFPPGHATRRSPDISITFRHHSGPVFACHQASLPAINANITSCLREIFACRLTIIDNIIDNYLHLQ